MFRREFRIRSANPFQRDRYVRYPVTWSLPDRGRSRRFARRDFVSLCRTKSRTAICTVRDFFLYSMGRIGGCPDLRISMKTERMKIGLFAAQLVLPAVPGLYVILFRPGVSLLTPRMLIPSMLCINLLALLLGWRRLGWSRNERLDAAMLLVMFALFPWLEYRVLPVGAFEGNLWAQVGCYCAGQAIGYVSVVLAPDWLGRLRQRRYEERVLSGREKFRSRKEVLEQRAEAQEAQRRAKELRRAKK